jgi:GAF domain-containing protein
VTLASASDQQPALDGRAVFPGDTHLLERVRATSHDARDALDGCVGLSISLRRDETLTFTFVRTDALPGVLDAMQYLDDGPCETTIRTGERIRIDDVLVEGRWPLFTKISAAAGIRSTLSLPLYRGPVVVGSVNIYGDTERAFIGKAAHTAMTFGSLVQAMIGTANLSSTPIPTAPVSTTPSGDQTMINQALALLTDKHGVPAATARQRLTDAATRARTTETEMANAIVTSL